MVARIITFDKPIGYYKNNNPSEYKWRTKSIYVLRDASNIDDVFGDMKKNSNEDIII